MPSSTSEEAEDGLAPISALQHYLFCPRQCALIHIERIWIEDGATAEGRLLHAKVDDGSGGRRRDVRVARHLTLRSSALGVTGKADAVEFRRAGASERPYPVEYKRGRPKSHRADEVQLCAQAMCLEEMLGTAVPEGALFYGRTRRRLPVRFDEELRALTRKAAQDVRAMFASARTPPAVWTPACRRCSLLDVCQPTSLQRPPSVLRWLAGQLRG